jgi:hypothetical protein
MRRLTTLLFAAVFAMSARSQASASTITLAGGALGISIGALPPMRALKMNDPTSANRHPSRPTYTQIRREHFTCRKSNAVSCALCWAR